MANGHRDIAMKAKRHMDRA